MKNKIYLFEMWIRQPLAVLLWLAASLVLKSFGPIKFENGENWLEKLVAVVPAAAYLVFYVIFTIFLLKMAKRSKGWAVKLDAVIANIGAGDPASVSIAVEDLPTAAEIVRDTANHPLLKEKLERLKYLLPGKRLKEDSRELLQRFIGNCEEGLAAAERNIEARRIPFWAWFRLFAVAALWLVASVAPMGVDHWLSSSARNGTGSPEKVAGAGTTEQTGAAGTKTATGTDDAGNNRVAAVFNFRELSLKLDSNSKSFGEKQPAAWLKILISVAFICIYLAFYAVLTVALFKMAKHLRQYYRQKVLHEDLSPLAALLAVRIDSSDTSRLRLRDRLVETLISGDDQNQ